MSPRKYDMSKRRAAAEATRARILEATMELHAAQGILATSWEDIAQRAGVAVGTVYRHFPTLDELVPACGELSLQRLALPATPRELLRDAAEPAQRLQLLVATCYGVYERAPGVMQAVRRERERRELPAVAESHAVIEAAIDDLVAEALRPLGAGREGRRLTRAVCDFDTWRALRRQGFEGEAAVDAALRLLDGVAARTT